ncbi:glycosyltransferase [Microbacterium gubbeenense]|uniref:glycosyltransferase n=1 Tax=Microbacterium gubbeenense TaxID=159896 RepID=UPI003F95BD89
MTGSAHDDAPLLSVVIPTHNVRPWLRQALDSVLRQDVDLEVIVVDDRSDDGTIEFAREAAGRDARVSVVSSPGEGGGSARNAGADLARGRYLVFADGDDLIPDGAYDALVTSLEVSGSDLAVGDYIKFRAVDTWRPTAAMPAYGRASRGVTLADEPTLLYSRPCWNRAFRREFWEASGVRFPDVPRSNDIVPMVSALVKAESIDVVDDVVYVYRERPGSGSMTARAGAATSLVSYLTQEAECARIVRDTRDADLAAVFADLVWDRDAFVAVNRYLLAWESDSEADALVAEKVRALLDLTPVPDEVGPLRRLALELAAAGSFAAGHAVARVAGGHPEGSDPSEERADLVSTWRALISELDSRELSDEERDMLTERLSRQLAQPRTGDPSAWQALVGAAERVLGERVRLFAADAWQSGDLGARERTAARAHSLAGGDLLAIDGTVSPDAGDVALALLDGEASLEGDGPRLIRPVSVTWRTADDGVRTWSAAFPAHQLPLHRPLTPVALGEDGAFWNVDAAFELPAYSRRDAFLYDVVDRILIVRRRRSWLLRGIIAAVRSRVRGGRSDAR